MAETTFLNSSHQPGASPGRQQVFFLGEHETRTARVLRRYRRHRKPRHQRQTDNAKDPACAASAPIGKSSVAGDDNSPHEMNPLLVVDVANSSDVSEDFQSSPGVVVRTAKLNGSPANAAVSVEEVAAEAARSAKMLSRWRKLQRGLELRRRLAERLAASEWWQSRRRRRFGGDVAESSRALQRQENSLDLKSFPDDDDFTVFL